MMKISQVSQHDSTWIILRRGKSSEYTCSQTLFTYPSSKPDVLSLKHKEGFRNPSGGLRFAKYTKSRRLDARNFIVHSSAEPVLPPSGGPPPNITSWIVTVIVALVIPFINYKWGPTLTKKFQSLLQTTEDVVEAVEKVAEEVEKVAEDIADDIPKDGKLREVVDFIEKLSETAAKDAGEIDDIIDKVQEEEEKLNREKEEAKQSLKEKDQIKKPPGESNDDDTPKEDNLYN